MSIKKPIIKGIRECGYCDGSGSIAIRLKSDYNIYPDCEECKGTGKADIKDFKKYYIKKLEEGIEDLTRLYRYSNKEAQEYLKKVKEYSKELDKVINK